MELSRNDNERNDVLFIAKIVLAVIAIGVLGVFVHVLWIKEGAFLPVIWSMTFLVCGIFVGILFGIPRILTQDEVPAGTVDAKTGNSNSRGPYRPSTHLERISEWLTTLIVGLTLVQWREVIAAFNSISAYVSTGINPNDPRQHLSFASAIFLYFAVTGFVGGYLMARTYLSRVFQRYDVGGTLDIDEVERRSINKTDNTDPRSTGVVSGLDAVARKITSAELDKLQSIDDITAWAKAQFATENYEQAVAGYRKATAILPSDVPLLLEYSNALFRAGLNSDAGRRAANRAESAALLERSYKLIGPTSPAELRMKVYRALTYFYLFSPSDSRDFEKVIRYGEEYVADDDPRKITSVGILVNLACAYAQQFKWLSVNGGSAEDIKTARAKALNYVLKTLHADRGQRWQKRLQTLLRSDIRKDPDDDDLEIFERDPEFREILGLAPLT